MTDLINLIIRSIFEFTIEVTGHFVWWLLQGAKGKFVDYWDRGNNPIRDNLTGLFIWLTLLYFMSQIFWPDKVSKLHSIFF